MTALILGTAQFGAGYGITNQIGRIGDAAVVDILRVARAAGIELFDTAPDYGDAQERLGKLRAPERPERFISKFRLPAESDAINATSLFGASLAALGAQELYGLLFHRVSDLRDSRAPLAWDILRSAREEGAVARIGASVYDADDLKIVVQRFPDLNLLQIPGNVLDTRLLDHPILRELHERGVEVHVRSAYLQGLLLAAPEDLPEYFQEFRPVIAALQEFAEQQAISVAAAALGVLKTNPLVDAVLVGATTAGELRDTVGAWNSTPNRVIRYDGPRVRAELLDPRLWPSKLEQK